MNYSDHVAQFSYRLAFIAAAVIYGTVVYRTWRARQNAVVKQTGGALTDENVQYLCRFIW